LLFTRLQQWLYLENFFYQRAAIPFSLHSWRFEGSRGEQQQKNSKGYKQAVTVPQDGKFL
jgi:hypothetical protein